MSEFEIGIYTLGDYVKDSKTNIKISEKERIEEIIKAAKLAEKYGLDVFSLGESHQEHFISQAHILILAAIARETSTIKLGSSANIISTSDPVRIYENFVTLDLLSNSRIELFGGRASRVGLFELLGYDVNDYDAWFEEKFDLLLKLNKNEEINWNGKFRKPLNNAILYPKPLKKLDIWRAVGSQRSSASLAAKAKVPMMLATLAGHVSIFKRTIDVYKSTYLESGYNPDEMKIGVTTLLHTDYDEQKAFRNFYQYVDYSLKKSNVTGFDKEAYTTTLRYQNSMLVGNPETIIEKILYQYDMYNHDRLMIQLDLGGMPSSEVEKNITILGKEIIPVVKAKIKEKTKGRKK